MKINADGKGTAKSIEKVELAKDEVTDISIRPGKVFRIPRYQPCSTNFNHLVQNPCTCLHDALVWLNV